MTNTVTYTQPNKYDVLCSECGQNVPAGTGLRSSKPVDGRWQGRHPEGVCPTAETIAAVAAAMTTYPPTAEQQHAIDLYLAGKSLVIEAGAGAGKTSTLRFLAAADLIRRCLYVAFGHDVVKDLGGSMPANVTASTVHALAYKTHGSKLSARQKQGGARQSSDQIAKVLHIDPIYVGTGDERRALAPGFLAGHVMKAYTRFCQSADDAPTVRHFGALKGVDEPGQYATSNAIAAALLPALQAAWADLRNPDGDRLSMTVSRLQETSVKMWQLSRPHLDADVIFYDEAQDASPVMAAVVADQTHAQRIYVGDSAQAIFGFTGAVDAIAAMKAEGHDVATLTQSFRFGPAIADRANLILADLDADLRLSGTESIDSTVGPIDDPDAILTRTNACAVECILTAREAGVVAHLVGEGKQVLAFARAARELQERGTTGHPELACFASWTQVQQYVEQDPQGDELALEVRLVDRFGADTIIEALGNMPAEKDADLIVSTAHKAKGREWGSVRIGADFAQKTKAGEDPEPLSAEELRLRYVACTRAKLALDCSALDTPDGSPQGSDDGPSTGDGPTAPVEVPVSYRLGDLWERNHGLEVTR